MSEKFEIKIDKKEVKNTINEVTDSDYYRRIAEQVKKIRSGQMNEVFKGNTEKWEQLFHLSALKNYDEIVFSILREEYRKYQQYIDPMKKLIVFYKINLKETLKKVLEKKR